MTRRILFAATDPITLISFMRGQVTYLQEQGFEVHLAAARTNALEEFARLEGASVHDVPLSRKWIAWADLVSTGRAWAVLRRVRPDVLSYSTPKASLVWALVSRLHRSPRIVFLLRGLRAEGEREGSRGRRLLLAMERIAASTADVTICVSDSLRSKAVDLGVLNRGAALVLGHGSSNGVDVSRFVPASAAGRAAARREIQAQSSDIVFGFVGRLTRDKGLIELLDAVNEVAADFPIRCVLIGEEEGLDVKLLLQDRPRARAVTTVRAATRSIEHEYAAMDIFVLPSYREGLSNSLLEAQSMAIPCITTTATGCAEAIDVGRSGTVVPPRDARALAAACVNLVGLTTLERQRMGAAGREWVIRHFTREHIWASLAATYAGKDTTNTNARGVVK